ncbi:sensor histidine kinase [Paenibacillus sepulcri]|uniref:Sensor histidine kinase n=1 Tax=Paenibacillus sepulcri TaxID=359917 RepID=A0ABS7BV90_9BACL|nr:sensor histidine kinase [Paenibacillus sepulcri]
MSGFKGRLSWIRMAGNVRTKLLLIFFIVAVLPLGTLGYFSYHKSSKVVNSQFGSYGMYAVEQLKLHFDSNIKQMDQITGNILAYMIASSIFIGDKPPTTYAQYVEERDFQNYLSSIESTNIFKVAVITPSGRVIGNSSVSMDNLASSSFWSYVSAYNNRHVVIHIPDYYSTPNDDYAISLIVPLKNGLGFPSGSRILIDMKADTILSLIRAFEKDMQSHLLIMDASGEILLQTSSDYVNQDDDIVWSRSLDTEDWIVEARIPYATFYESSTVILRYSLFIAVLAVIVGVIMAGFFSFRFTRPIMKLAQSMRRFGDGDLLIRTPVMSSDELGYLSETFNRMTGQIQGLVHEISRTEKLKSDAELRALHYQINPHLLFNTLNSIQWKAKLAHQPEILKMLQHLIVVLDGSFNFKQTLVPLHKELEIARHFIEIQRFRYEDVFTCVFDIQPGLDDCLVPRMVFQPLLENIFFHGFRDGLGHINMRIFTVNCELYMELEDDGVGVKLEHMEFISSGMKIPGKQGGLGLRNVDERFKLHFGNAYGLTLESNRNIGTKVTLAWPITRELNPHSKY